MQGVPGVPARRPAGSRRGRLSRHPGKRSGISAVSLTVPEGPPRLSEVSGLRLAPEWPVIFQQLRASLIRELRTVCIT